MCSRKAAEKYVKGKRLMYHGDGEIDTFNSRKLTENKVTELFCIADDFCKFFDAMMEK